MITVNVLRGMIVDTSVIARLLYFNMLWLLMFTFALTREGKGFYAYLCRSIHNKFVS